MIFDGATSHLWRQNTDRMTQHAGITVPRRRCQKCGKNKTTGGGIVRHARSRHEPSVFICAECREDKPNGKQE